MARILTTDELVADVRSLLDETNELAIDTDTDILPALNRAQDFAVDILARKYEEPILKVYTVTPEADGSIPFPEDILEDRIEKVESKQGTTAYNEVRRISYRDITPFENQGSGLPYYYYLRDKTVVLLPPSSYPVRIWYLKDPDPLVLKQGTITKVNEAESYITLDQVGADLTTESDNLNSYFSVVNYKTGEIKGSFQVKTILTGKRIIIKTIPTRTTVLGKTILTSLTSLDITPDDVICTIHGTCIPFLKKPLSNFLVQYAHAELTRKLGGEGDIEARLLEKLEQQLERTWVGRENTLRVKKRNRMWGTLTRPYRTKD